MFENEFRGKRVLITGAAGVIGSWIANAFSKAGAQLLLSDIRDNELSSVAHKLEQDGANVITHRTNLLEESSMRELVHLVADTWNAPDIVINNAGLYHRYNLLDMSLVNWDEVMEVNVRAPFFLTQQLANLMISENVEGNIVNLISGAAYNTGLGGGHYSTSKAALAMLTRAFALELAPFHIRVNGVGPGFAPGSGVSMLSEEYVENMISTIPLGRVSGPNDAPSAVLFLCSSYASFITGAILNVDGGKSAGTFKAKAQKRG